VGAVELLSSLLQSAINANILICNFIQIAQSSCLEEVRIVLLLDNVFRVCMEEGDAIFT